MWDGEHDPELKSSVEGSAKFFCKGGDVGIIVVIVVDLQVGNHTLIVED